MDKFLTVDEIAEMLKVKKATVLKYIKNGELKANKKMNKYIIWEKDLEKFLKS